MSSEEITDPESDHGPDDVQFGGARVNGHNINRLLLHNPVLEQAQIGATIRKLLASKMEEGESTLSAIGSGVFAAAIGVAEEVPFVSAMFEISSVQEPHRRGSVAGRYVPAPFLRSSRTSRNTQTATRRETPSRVSRRPLLRTSKWQSPACARTSNSVTKAAPVR